MHILEVNAYGNRVLKVVDSTTGRTLCRCDSVTDAQRIIAALSAQSAECGK